MPNDDAPRVREVFRFRAQGKSYRDIEEATGIKYPTVRAILGSRIYLGEVLHNGAWSEGRHEPIVTGITTGWATKHPRTSFRCALFTTA